MGLDGKKTKLKAADINKVDFVPAGAQQGSRISLFKSADGDQEKGVLAKIADAIAKALSGFQVMPIDDEAATTFNEELAEQKVENAMCEMWDYTYALREAIKSILCSKEADKVGLVRGSIDQFANAIESAVPSWLNGEKVAKAGRKISSDRMCKLKDMHKALTDLIAEADASEEADKTASGSQVAKATDNNEPNKAENGEGSEGNMAENKDTKVTKAAIAALPQEMQDYIASLEAKVEKAAPVADPPAASAEGAEDIYKGLPEAVVKILKDTTTQNKQLAEQVAKMADEKLTTEYVAKASQFDKLGIKAEEFGTVLKSIASVSPEAYTKVEAVLKAANEAIAKGALFTELGSSSGETMAVSKDDAWAQITELANARVTKGDDKTLAQAIESVMKTAEGHKLYAIYTGKA
jgi:hypothetical protein